MKVCNYCNSEFYDNSTLLRHQRNSKNCLKIQLEKEPNKIIKKFYEC